MFLLCQDLLLPLSHVHAFLLKLKFLVRVMMTAVQCVGGVQPSWISPPEQLCSLRVLGFTLFQAGLQSGALVPVQAARPVGSQLPLGKAQPGSQVSIPVAGSGHPASAPAGHWA